MFKEYTKPYMKEIEHPVLIQEWKLNLDTEAYKKKLNDKENIPSNKNKLFVTVANNSGQKYY